MSRRGASNWRGNTASQNMFLNIFFVHHNSTAAAEHGSDFRDPVNDREFLSVEWTPSRPKGVPTMSRKTMIVLAKGAALASGLTVEAFADGGGRGRAWSALRMVAR
jgi:hypothetical protein